MRFQRPSLSRAGAGTILPCMRARLHAAVIAALAAATFLPTSACKRSDASTAPTADVVASEHGFTPTSFDVPAGGPGSHATVTFVRTTDKTCATEVVFPDLKIEKKLPLNE